MSKKLGETTKVTAGIAPAALTAAVANGIVIDRFGFWDAVVHLKLGTASGTPTGISVPLKVQTGSKEDGSDMADVSGDTIAALTVAGAEAKLNLDLSAYKQYLRIVVTPAFTGGTTPAIPIAVTVALGNAVSTPV